VAESLGALVSLRLLRRITVIITVGGGECTIFPERLPHWGMLLSQMPLELLQPIDYARLTYLWHHCGNYGHRATQCTAIDPSMLTQSGILDKLLEFPGAVAKVAEDLQIAAREIEHLQENKPNV